MNSVRLMVSPTLPPLLTAKGSDVRSTPHPQLSRPTSDGRSQAPSPLDDEIKRAEAAYQLMLVADTCLRAGADQLLLRLGFSQAHVESLRKRAGPSGGYPAYSLRNIRQTLRELRKTREAGTSLS